MASRFSDPNWWPTPPPERPASVSKIMIGTVLPLLAIIGAVAAVLTFDHKGSDAAGPVPAGAVTAQTRTVSRGEGDRRAAFAECLRSVAGSGGNSVGGRFGRTGPSAQFRRAVDVCRSLLQPNAAPAAPPAPTSGAAPVA
jgi:hypothetical protein